MSQVVLFSKSLYLYRFRNNLIFSQLSYTVESGTHQKRGEIRKALRVGKIKIITMKRLKTVLASLAFAAIMTSCAVTLPINATSNPVGNKVGSATAMGYLGIFFFNADASIKTAAKNGGITKISTVDIKQTNFLNLVITYETIVTGE